MPERFDALRAELGALYQIAPNFREEDLRSITMPVMILAEEEIVTPDQPGHMA